MAASYLDNLIINGLMVNIAARMRVKKGFSKSAVIEFLKKNGDLIAASMVEQIPQNSWTEIAKHIRRL